jgi:3D (Asp-Asp-Asp) domain-containing protein
MRRFKMIVKSDANNYRINETVKRVPLKETATVSLAVSTSGSATKAVPSNEMWFIKSWTVTKGADVTVSGIKVDNNDTYQTVGVNDTVAQYGSLLNADKNVAISGSNASTTVAQNLEITVVGYKLVF